MGTGWSQDESAQSQQREAEARLAAQPGAVAQRPAPKEACFVSQNQIYATNTCDDNLQPKPKYSSSSTNQGAASSCNNNPQPKPKHTPSSTNQAVKFKLPHNCESIIKDSDSSVDKSSVEKLHDQLYAGIFLNGKRKRYWVEKKSNCNCFVLFPSDLLITWGEDKRYWNWGHISKTSNNGWGTISVAELVSVCWLEVRGKFNTSMLSPQVTYQVAYIIMVKDSAYGWEVPVNIRFTLPNGIKQERKENLNEKPRGQWIQIRAGEFKASSENIGEIEFSMYEYEGGQWKSGLVIKGVTIQPVI